MLDLLSAVVREGTGKNARVSIPAGGKTGTTQDSRDAWFVALPATSWSGSGSATTTTRRWPASPAATCRP